jgi:lipoate-protein ligase A
MALDQVLLTERAQGCSPNTLRFLQFSPPAALVGYHQDVAQEIRVAYCREAGIDVNRRLTGGGAILFDESQLGWELIASADDVGGAPFSLEFHRRICGATIAALREFGLDAAFRPRNDIEVGGRKISGTGGVEEGRAFLFQGTLLLDFDVAAMIRALRIPTEKLKQSSLDSAADRVTWLRRELGELPPLDSIKQAIVRGFEKTFDVRLERGDLLPEEQSLFQRLLPEFQSPSWIERTTRAASNLEIFRGLHRTNGAVIRASVQVDTARKRLRSALITGDFFIWPRRAVFDIEARLKDHRLDETMIRQSIVELWQDGGVQAVGFGPEDVAAAIRAALDKRSWLDVGLAADEADRIFTTNGTVRDVLSRPIALLLLPYCAKRPECAFRHEQGCAACGDCTVGEAFALAERFGMRPVTITSFEHLTATLSAARRDGIEAYVGCCCEAFFQKHFEDFRAAGLPGILMDIRDSTCYDLDQARRAYHGQFEQQTRLDLPLLERVLNAADRIRSSTFRLSLSSLRTK